MASKYPEKPPHPTRKKIDRKYWALRCVSMATISIIHMGQGRQHDGLAQVSLISTQQILRIPYGNEPY